MKRASIRVKEYTSHGALVDKYYSGWLLTTHFGAAKVPKGMLFAGTYSLTHLPSGLAVGHFDQLKVAARVATKIERMAPETWNMIRTSKDAIRLVSGSLRNQIQDVVARANVGVKFD